MPSVFIYNSVFGFQTCRLYCRPTFTTGWSPWLRKCATYIVVFDSFQVNPRQLGPPHYYIFQVLMVERMKTRIYRTIRDLIHWFYLLTKFTCTLLTCLVSRSRAIFMPYSLVICQVVNCVIFNKSFFFLSTGFCIVPFPAAGYY